MWAGGLACALAGCGMPGAPQPPSLNLPMPVENLTAVRAGDQVTLAWTMPTRTTDKLLLKDAVSVRVCREAEGAKQCLDTGLVAPGASGHTVDALPAALATGTPRPLAYVVELQNSKGRSAGPSNAATVLAGAAPAGVDGLTAEVRKDGVVLRWTPVAGAAGLVRLQRKLVAQAATKKSKGQQDALAAPPEPALENLLVETGPQDGRALDKTAQFGETYVYQAQRVARVEAGGKQLELDGAWSSPLTVLVRDVFPPAVPAGLAAVAVAGEASGGAGIDLNWQPDGDEDLAGYVVYRRETGGAWQRISGAKPVAVPAYHDGTAQAGHTYAYAVTAVGQNGQESARSAAAQETMPQQ